MDCVNFDILGIRNTLSTEPNLGAETDVATAYVSLLERQMPIDVLF